MGIKIRAIIFLYTFTILFQLSLSMGWDEYFNKSFECEQSCGGEKHFYDEMRKGNLLCFRNPRKDIERVTPCTLKCLGLEAPPDQSNCWCEACKHGFDPELNFCEKPFDKSITEDQCKSQICSGSMGNLKYFGIWCTGDAKDKIENAKQLEKEHKLQ